jgi:hypothetical protein
MGRINDSLDDVTQKSYNIVTLINNSVRGDIMKLCKKCGEMKDESCFHKDKYAKDGLRNICKSCRNKGTPRNTTPPKLVESKICENCGKEYTPTSNRQQWCNECGTEIKHQNRIKACKQYYHEHKELKGCHPRGEESSSYKDGIGLYKKKRKSACERCGATENLVVHHKDRDRHNNQEDNLETLCRKCHFKEHHIKDAKGRFYKSH